jgi:hypothetical protein
MNYPVRPLSLLLCLALTGCGSAAEPPAGPSSQTLLAAADGSYLQLENFSDSPVFYMIHERGAAALINWAPCADLARCPYLPARARTRLPYSAIGAYELGKHEAILWWWESLGGEIPGEIHAVVIGL